MPEVVSDIIVSPASVWQAPVGETPPADSTAAGADWGGSWEMVGYTNAPLTVAYEFDSLDLEIEQSLAPVGRVKTKEGLRLETVMAELYLDGLQLAWGGEVTQTAAGAGQVGKEELDLGGETALDERAWGFEGTYVDEDGDTFPVRLFVWRATASAGGELKLGKTEATGVPLKVAALADMTKAVGQRLFKVQKILAPAAS
jgi:hypothetical protein